VPEDGKRVFAITDAGRAELEKHKDAAERVWSRASSWDDWRDAASPGAMEVMGPAIRLARAAFGKAARGDDKQIERIRQILAKAVGEVEKV
jgi:DNA-binding PadR family transcriptional regulator